MESAQKQARPAARLLVQMTEADLERLKNQIVDEVTQAIAGRTAGANDAPLTRKQAADWLGISLSKLDLLTGREGLKYFRVGECKRFWRDDLRAWLNAHPADNAA